MTNEQDEIKRLARKAYQAKYYAEHKEHHKATVKKYRLKHQEEHRIKYRERRAARNKSYRERNRHLILRGTRKYLYNLTHETYLQMFTTQEGKCAICDKLIYELTPDKQSVAHIDHCHTTKKVRGLLCRPCNYGLGYFRDSINLMRRASQYLLDNG